MLNTAFAETFPALPNYLQKNCFSSFIIFWIFIILASVIMISLIMGIFFFIYQKILSLNYKKVCQKFPDFEDKIKNILEQDFSSYEGVDKVIQHYRGKNVNLEGQTPNYLVKFRNAVKKISLINKYHNFDIIKPHFYIELKNSIIGTFTDLLLSFYSICIPVIVQSLTNTREIQDYIFQSELLAIFFLID